MSTNVKYIDISSEQLDEIERLVLIYQKEGFQLFTIYSFEVDILHFGKYLCVNYDEKIIYFDSNK